MSRQRCDPRAEGLARMYEVRGRRRLDRANRCAAAEIAETAIRVVEPAIITIDHPAFLVAIVRDSAGPALSAWDRQLLGAGRVLAAEDGAVVLVTGQPCDTAGPAGADRTIAMPALEAADPDLRTRRIAAFIVEYAPRHVLFAESPASGDLARRVSALTGEVLFSDAELVTLKLVTRPARARCAEQSRPPAALIAVVQDVALPYAGTEREARILPSCNGGTPAEDDPIRFGLIMRDPAQTPLGEADFVIAAGNGVTDFESFGAVVAALEATPGASRAICDAGLLPRDRQVGASGTVLAGSCYLAFGIAGAPQHLQGVTKVEHVIAVNTDLHAAMIKRASLAIVADAQAVMPAVVRQLAARRIAASH